MNKYLQKIKQASRKYQIIGGAVVLVLVLFLYFYFRDSNGGVEYLTVKKDTVIQEVAITGKTEAIDKVDLAFEKSGKIAVMNAVVGERVESGQFLAALDSSDLSAQLEQATALISSAKARMNEIQTGARREDVRVIESQFNGANINLVDAKRELINTIQDSYLKADEAVYYYVDTFFDDPKTSNASVNFTISDSNLKIDLGLGRVTLENMLGIWKTDMSLKQNDPEGLFAESQKNLSQLKSFIDKLSIPINEFTAEEILALAMSGDKSTISSARTSVNLAISNLSTAYEKYNSAKSALSTSQDQLDLKTAKPTQDTLIQQQSLVDQAEAGYLLIVSQIAKNRIVAPISGIVTKAEAKLGEISNPGVNVISIIAPNNLEITANVPEVDIGKVKMGDPVRLTFDAFPGEEFTGLVSYLEPAETIIDGVVNYKIKIKPTEKDDRIKSGLTANLNIQTVIKRGVLSLPEVAIIENDKGAFVQKVSGQNSAQSPVKIGTRGQDGLVEILEGLKEGDRVVNVGAKAQ